MSTLLSHGSSGSKPRWLRALLNALMAAVLIRFAIPKVAGAKVSRRGFEDMATVLNEFMQISGDTFRVFVGVSEIAVAVLLSAGAALAVAKFSSERLISAVGNLAALGLMVGAMFSEYVLRSAPKTSLVLIALVLIVISTFNLVTVAYQQALD